MSYHELTGIEVKDGVVRQFRQDQPESPVEAVVEPEGEKTLKSMTKAELVEFSKAHGVPGEVAEGLTKAELVDSIERLTHTSD